MKDVHRLREYITSGDLAAIRACVRDGADLRAPVIDGLSALQYATKEPLAADIRVDIIRLLLELGADSNVLSSERAVALSDAASSVTDGAFATPLNTAASHGNTEAAGGLIAAGTDVNARDHRDSTALGVAVRRGDAEAAGLLVAAGGDINGTYQGSRLVLIACRRGDAAMVRLLAGLGADCTGSVGLGAVPAALRSRDQRAALLEALVEAGVDVTAPVAMAGFPVLPLHYVAYKGDKFAARVICRAIRERGKSLQDETGAMALQVASTEGVRRVLTTEMNYERRDSFLCFLSGSGLLGAAPRSGGSAAPPPVVSPAARVLGIRDMQREIMAFV